MRRKQRLFYPSIITRLLLEMFPTVSCFCVKNGLIFLGYEEKSPHPICLQG